jgi:2-polyprenyl-6-methoxyphenol hydroxylase-like FAD-dependent oxidoreductase
VRGIAFGPESLFARPFGMFVGTMHTAIDGGDPHELRLYNQPGISLAIHPATGNPLAAFIFRSTAPYDYRDPDARKRLVEAAYSGRGWVTDRAVGEWLATDDVYFDAVTRITMPTWTKGRISLLGDAADCISLLGEGSSNAIVAAKTLADALAAGPDVPIALAGYETTHRRRLRTFQRRASMNSHLLVPATGLGLGMRDTGLRIASKLSRSRAEASRSRVEAGRSGADPETKPLGHGLRGQGPPK